MPGAGVHQLTGVGAEHRAEGGGAARAGQPRGELVQRRQRGAGAGVFEQQCPAGAAQLTHDGRRGQAVADAVADDQRDAAVVEVDDVVPVAADLQRAGGRLVAHRESAGQTRGPEDRVLQRQRGFPLLVELMHPLQTLTEATGQHREQRVVFGGERSSLGQLDVHHEHAPWMLQRDARRRRVARCRG